MTIRSSRSRKRLGSGSFFVGNGIQNAAGKADEAADHRGKEGQLQRVPDTAQIHGTVFHQQQGHVLPKLHQFVHGSHSYIINKGTGPEPRPGGENGPGASPADGRDAPPEPGLPYTSGWMEMA